VKIEEAILTSQFSNLHEKAIVNIIFTANGVQDALKMIIKPYGISLPQYNVLRILNGRKKGYATCGDLKAVMLDKNPDVTRLCDKLVDKDLISRHCNAKNKRQILLQISDKGEDVLAQINPKIYAFYEQLNALNQNDIAQLSDCLDAIRNEL
jgi:DNA-binding MarR family transcriptional regulator